MRPHIEEFDCDSFSSQEIFVVLTAKNTIGLLNQMSARKE